MGDGVFFLWAVWVGGVGWWAGLWVVGCAGLAWAPGGLRKRSEAECGSLLDWVVG